MNNEILSLAKELRVLKDTKATYKKLLSDTEEQYDQLEYKLVLLMNEQDLKSLKIDGVGNVIKMQKCIAKVNDRPALFEYLMDNGMEDLITQSVNYHTLNELNGTNLTTNGTDLPGCESILKETITIRKT